MCRVILSVDCVKYPLTGIGRYTLELSRALLTAFPSGGLLCYNGDRVFPLQNWIAGLECIDFCEGGNLRLLKNIAKKSLLDNKLYFWLKERRLSHFLTSFNEHIFHSTNFICPRFQGKKVVTFHDMSAFFWSECQERQRVSILRDQCEDSIRRADAIITDSYSVQSEISAYFNYPIQKIFVTHMACDEGFKPRREAEVIGVLRKFGLTYKKFSLFVGTLEPRKNIETLIAAYQILPASLRKRFPLVIVGCYGWKCDKIREMVTAAQEGGWLLYLNYVSNSDLKCLYSSAKFFCFPSLYEGFGIPVLEAMASGVPVIASNNSSIPEVLGNAGKLIEAKDVELWATTLQEVLQDSTLENQMTEAGINRAKKFSWAKCASETVKVYQSISY